MRSYRIPEKMRPEVDRQIDELLAAGKIRESNSPYAHPIVLVSKPDSSTRLCVDFRWANAQTLSDPYPIPRSDEMLRKIGSSNFITNLDCTSGYYQIPMDPESIPMTAFLTHRSHYENLYMPFGLKTAGSTFQRAMDQLLDRHRSYASAYTNDTCVHSATWDEHLKHLTQVLQAFKDAGMTLKLKKCSFGKPRVKFIGHVVGSGEQTVIHDKVEAIKKIPEPQTKKQLRSFIALCSYYRMYINSFADIVSPLSELLKGTKSGRVALDNTQRRTFEILKERLCSTEVLAVPKYDRPFRLYTDSSDYAVGSTLAQLDHYGRERPLGFASAKLTETQRRWSILEREAFAVIHALNHFEVIVHGSPIRLYCDNDPLQALVNNSLTSNKICRWMLYMQKFDITVYHIPGSLNIVADNLSRVQE